MPREGLPAFSPGSSRAGRDSSRKASHHDRDRWMVLLPASTCMLQPLAGGDPNSAAPAGAEEKSRRLLSPGSDTHVLHPATGWARGLAVPHLLTWLAPSYDAAGQVTTAHMKCTPGSPTTAQVTTKMATIKSFLFCSTVSHLAARITRVLSCGQQIPKLSLGPKHALATLQMPPCVC